MRGKILILVLLVCIFYSSKATADELYGFLAMRCIPELNYFDVSPIWASNVGKFLSKDKDREKLSKDYNIFEENRGGEYICPLDSGTVAIEFVRNPPGSSGMCGGSPQTTISISQNNRLLVRNVVFNDGCFSASVERVAFQDSTLLISMHARRGHMELPSVFNESINVEYERLKIPVTQEYIDRRSSELKNEYIKRNH